MDEEKVMGRILDCTEERIFSEGLKNLTMDEVASDAGVSKKTLYRVIPSKNDLILMVVNRKMDGVERKQKAVIEDPGLGFQEKVDGVIRVISKVLVQVGRRAIQDLSRLSPDLWELIRRRRQSIIKGLMVLLEEGRREGVVRDDLSAEFIAAFFLQTVDTMITPQMVLKLDMPPKDLVDGVLKMFFNGVLKEPVAEGRR